MTANQRKTYWTRHCQRKRIESGRCKRLGRCCRLPHCCPSGSRATETRFRRLDSPHPRRSDAVSSQGHCLPQDEERKGIPRRAGSGLPLGEPRRREFRNRRLEARRMNETLPLRSPHPVPSLGRPGTHPERAEEGRRMPQRLTCDGEAATGHGVPPRSKEAQEGGAVRGQPEPCRLEDDFRLTFPRFAPRSGGLSHAK